MARDKVVYSKKFLCFDIETTHEHVSDDCDIIYTWHWSVMDSDYNYHTCTSWNDFFKYILGYFAENAEPTDTRMICYVHNLSYETEAIIRNLNGREFTTAFYMDTHEPLYFVINDKIEFRCSYKLTNKSLKACGKDVGLEKLEMDYTDIVKPGEKLPPEKEAYTYRDVEIMVAKIHQLEEQEGKPFYKFPYTNTGFLRDELRDIMRTDYKWRKMFKNTRLHYKEYVICRKAFMGGYTHANYMYSGKVMNDVDSYDFGSAYPFAIATEKFPCSPLKKLDGANIYDLKRLMNTDGYLFICTVTMKNVKAKGTMTYLSSSHCDVSKDCVLDNGRIYKADMVQTTCTSLDLAIIIKMYNIKAIRVDECYYCRADYLPSGIVKTMLKYYNDKQKLKHVNGEELNYAKAKNRVNSFYGMFVQDPIHDVITLDGAEWEIEHTAITNKDEIDEQLDKFYKSYRSFLPYQIGVFIPAYTRYHLLHDIVSKIDRNVLYCDTDSAKIINRHECLDVINEYNDFAKYKIGLAIERYVLDYKLPDLGIFDWETEKGAWKEFKTYGAKKYCLRDANNELQMTVSGLSKEAVGYLTSIDDFAIFTTFDKDVSGRTISHPTTNAIATYDNGGTWIEDTTYTLSISPEYGALIGIDVYSIKPTIITKEGKKENTDTDISKRFEKFTVKTRHLSPIILEKIGE